MVHVSRTDHLFDRRSRTGIYMLSGVASTVTLTLSSPRGGFRDDTKRVNIGCCCCCCVWLKHNLPWS